MYLTLCPSVHPSVSPTTCDSCNYHFINESKKLSLKLVVRANAIMYFETNKIVRFVVVRTSVVSLNIYCNIL